MIAHEDNTGPIAPDRERFCAILDRLGLREDVPPEAIDEVLPLLDIRAFPAGTIVVEQGQPGDELYVVEAGELEVAATLQGRRVRLATLRPGDVFGERALLRDSTRSATVTARTPVQLWALGRSTLNDIIRRIPIIGVRLHDVMRRRELENALRALQ